MDTEGNEILYDLIQDPDEFKNISKEESYKEVVSIMRKEMIVKLQETCYRGPNQTAAY